MLAVVKKPHTSRILFKVNGNIPKWLLSSLKKQYGNNLDVIKEIPKPKDEETINILETSWYKNINESMKPGDYLKVYREKSGITQETLGNKLGNFSRQNISAMERSVRGISKPVAKQLALILNAPIENFL